MPEKGHGVMRSMSVPTDRVELEQSASNLLALPIFIAIILVAVVVSQFAHGNVSAVVVGICAGAAVLDALMAWYFARHLGSSMTVTTDEISFTKQQGKRPPARYVIRRTDGSTLSFRVARNGPFGSEYTGYILKLRDNATGDEVFAGAFGRRRVQQACESQGWSFAKSQ
jgi:hypothetical protein